MIPINDHVSKALNDLCQTQPHDSDLPMFTYEEIKESK